MKTYKWISVILLPSLLCSCSKGDYSLETISTPPKLEAAPSLKDSMIQECQAYFSSEKEIYVKDKGLYSPLSEELMDWIKADGEASLASYKSLSTLLNFSEKNCSLEVKGAYASTDDISSTVKEDYEKNYVSSFQGTLAELGNSLSRFYNRDIKLVNKGNYYMDSLDLQDKFPLPSETKKDFAFTNADASSSSLTAIVRESGTTTNYYEGDQSVLSDMEVGKTAFRILLPNKGVGIDSVSPLGLFSHEFTENEKKTVRFTLPEFSLSSSFELPTKDLSFTRQDNVFELNEYGVKGTSFTINGPTATDPSYEKDLTADRPFYFASLYQGLPLFVGKVSKL